MGPTYRADVWVALEAAPHLSVAELARRTYASFATAWQAKQDFEILAGAREGEEGLTSKEPSVRCGWRRGRRSPSVNTDRILPGRLASPAPMRNETGVSVDAACSHGRFYGQRSHDRSSGSIRRS